MNLPASKLVVTSALTFWRSGETRETSAVAKQLLESKASAGEDLVVSGAFYQEPTTPKLHRLLGSASKIGGPILAGAALLGLGVASIPLGIAAGALALTGALVGLGEASKIQSNFSDFLHSKKAKAPEGLDVWRDGGPALSLPVNEKTAPGDGLRELLAANLRDFPSSLHVVHANGHGIGAKYSAGLPGETLATSLQQATERSGRPVDVLLLESCFGANFEQLARFGPTVKYVVGFEDAIPTSAAASGRIPLGKMLQEGLDEPTARGLAIEMAELSSQHFDQPGDDAIASVPLSQRLRPEHLDKLKFGTDSTAVAVDMEALRENLSPAMNALGTELHQPLQNDSSFKGAIREARKAASISENGDLIDLGIFLAHLATSFPPESSTHLAIDSTLKELEKTLISKRTGDLFPLSGLSLHTDSTRHRASTISAQPSEPYSASLPGGWLAFAKQAFP